VTVRRRWIEGRSLMSRLPARHKAWVVAKLIVVVWIFAYAAFTPAATFAALGGFVWTTAVVTTAGILLSIAGMIVALQPNRTPLGKRIETSGILVALAGPAVHAVTMVTLTVQLLMTPEEGVDPLGRVGPFFQSVCIAGFLVVRLVEVRSRTTLGSR
jgi:hypothetical protein